jgi:RNA polymerase sigma factor (sigma-70 family)
MSEITNTEPDIDDLLKAFQTGIQENKSWVEIWQLFVKHPAFLGIATKVAVYVARRHRMPICWIEDIKQESYLYFARLIQKDRDLRFDPDKGSLSTWLGTVMFGCCSKATRQFRDSRRQQSAMPGRERTESPIKSVELYLDLLQQINRLDNTTRVVFFLSWEGKSIDEIAAQIGKSERTVYRHLEQAAEIIDSLIST